MSHKQFANVLLKSLSGEGFALLALFLNEIELTYRQQIELPHEPIAYMVFLEGGVISVVATSPDGRDTEVGATPIKEFTPVFSVADCATAGEESNSTVAVKTNLFMFALP
ncbi:hypothetical protein [Candidatus Phyllobacterium onerii]|uniref:hypothetical protein n=1 Tax=Candidatus Phyllobacterium onerii TaxID=3020828 RepID=UPI00232FDF23|nr:hypothetical protein [Phyllobacterium sp. IY22]